MSDPETMVQNIPVRILLRIGIVRIRTDGRVRWPLRIAPWRWWRAQIRGGSRHGFPRIGFFRNLPGVIKWERGRLLPRRWGGLRPGIRDRGPGMSAQGPPISSASSELLRQLVGSRVDAAFTNGEHVYLVFDTGYAIELAPVYTVRTAEEVQAIMDQRRAVLEAALRRARIELEAMGLDETMDLGTPPAPHDVPRLPSPPVATVADDRRIYDRIVDYTGGHPEGVSADMVASAVYGGNDATSRRRASQALYRLVHCVPKRLHRLRHGLYVTPETVPADSCD